MDRDQALRELQEQLDAERRISRQEKERRVAAENIIKKTAFVPFLCYCYRILFRPVSVQKAPSLRSSGEFIKVDGRYYPRELQTWTEFPKLHDEAFGELEALFGEQELFPSQLVIDHVLRDLSPSPLASEEDLQLFEVAAIELRAKDVITQYLTRKPQEVSRVIFRSNPYSLLRHNIVEMLHDRIQTRSQARSRGRSQIRSGRRSSNHSPQGSATVERRIVPDCWCMAQNADKVRRALFTVEYKAGHKLMPEALIATLDGRLSDQVLFADAAEAARLAEEKRQRSKLGDVASAEEEDAESTADITTEQENNETSPSPSLKTARNRTAQILTQAFHHMVDSGLAYSYVSTGESLIFLHVNYDDDPSVLYYHLSVPKTEICLPELQEEDVVDHGSMQHSAATARQTPVALVLTLILLALQKTPLSFEAKEQVKDQIRAFPNPYNSTAEAPGPSQATSTNPAQQGAREGGGQSGSSIEAHTARLPQQSYCTQKCLRGLKSGLALDHACPNIALHRCLGNDNRHGITHAQLLSAVKEQLTRNLDDGCAALDGHGKFGAIGALFRVIAYPQGYTFVAKGVQDDDRESLDLENRVYQQLAVLQGSVVPVCLGLVDLRRAYVLTGGARVLRLMLLSYAGERAQPEQVSEEVERGLDGTLRTHGVEHGDLRLANVLWSEELCRLMVVDFDRATLHTKRKRGVEKELRQDKKSNTAWAKVG